MMPLTLHPLTVIEVMANKARSDRALDAYAKTVLTENKKFEDECWQQAKAELENDANSGWDFTMRITKRAMEIKRERRGQK